MRLWQTAAGELAGAWRSIRYDLDRRRAVRQLATLTGADTADLTPAYRTPSRPARRPMAATGVAMLVAGGAAGTYLAVAGGLTALTADPASPLPSAPPAAAAIAAAPDAGVPAGASPKAPKVAVGPRVAVGAAQAPRRPAGPQVAAAVPVPVAAPDVVPAPPSHVLESAVASPEPGVSPSPTVSPSPSPSASPVDSPSAGQYRASWRTGAGG